MKDFKVREVITNSQCEPQVKCLDDGMRVLARMIARRYIAECREAQKEEDSTKPGSSIKQAIGDGKVMKRKVCKKEKNV